jgi:hypothetical protein
MNKEVKKLITNEEVTASVIRLNKIKNKYDEIKKSYETEKKSLEKKIKDFLNTHGTKGVIVYDGDTAIDAKLVQSTKVIFDAEAIENKFDKEFCNEVIIKKYTINNYDGLVKYLKSCGVNSKIFKEYISVEKTVDTPTLNNMFDLGELSLDNMQGCYTVTTNEGHIKINSK